MSDKTLPPTLRLGICYALLFLTGCVGPQKRVAREIPPLHERWQADVAHQSALPERRLSWDEALELLRANNMKMRSARMDITNSQELARQAYRDLIPTVNLRSGVTKSLKDIPSMSFDDVTFNVDNFFNIPGIVNFNSRVFAGKLEVMRAQIAARLVEREQTIDLYKIFLETRENEEQAAELKTERRLADAVLRSDEIYGQVLLKDVGTQELQLEKSVEGLHKRTADLLADRKWNWVLTTNGLPDLDYASRPLPLDDTNRVAQLQTRMVAIETVGAWAQIKGIKLQYWPEFSVFVSGPSAFQYQDGSAQFGSPQNMVGSANFFWAIDTRGYVAQQLRTTRRSQELQKAQLRQDSLALIDRLIAARQMEGSLRDQSAKIDRLLTFLERVPPDSDVSSILQRAETNRSLHFQLARLRREMAELNTEFWFVDEERWTAPNG